MRHQRKLSDITRTAADVFMQAKRRFQFKPGPTRKPHVYDIISNVPQTDHTLQDKKKSISLNAQKHHTLKSLSTKKIQKTHQQKDTLAQANNKIKHNQSYMMQKQKQSQQKVHSSKLFSHSLMEPRFSSKQLTRSKSKVSKDLCEFKKLSMPLKIDKEKQNLHKNSGLPFNFQSRKNSYLSQIQNYQNKNSSLNKMPNTKLDYGHKTKTSLQNDIQVLKIQEPTTESKLKESLEFIDISLTDIDIHVENVKESDTLFKSQQSSISKRFRYDVDAEDTQSKYSSAISLSPVKGYDFDKEQKSQMFYHKRRKPSLQIAKGVKEPIVQQEEDKNLDSRVLQNKFNLVFQVLDDKHLGVINNSNSCYKNLHPNINSLISPITKKMQDQKRSFTKKQFILETKRILLSMKEKQISKILNCQVFHESQERKLSHYNLKTTMKQNKTLPLKNNYKPYNKKGSSKNSVGSIQLSQLSLQDSFELSSNPPLQRELLAQRSKDLGNLNSWYRAVESEIQASRIDALNERLSVYITRNNIVEKGHKSNQISLQFNELEKHLYSS